MKQLFSFILAGMWFAADYFSKIWAMQTLSAPNIAANNYTMFINDYMNLKLAFNRGAAFSFLSNSDGWQIWLFSGLAAVVSLWLIYSLIFENLDRLTRIGYASVLGGALGNLYDRLIHGYVIDFIHWHYQQYHWPVFNIADTAITIGVVAVILSAIASMRNSSSVLG